jgi:hypothetical protein
MKREEKIRRIEEKGYKVTFLAAQIGGQLDCSGVIAQNVNHSIKAKSITELHRKIFGW